MNVPPATGIRLRAGARKLCAGLAPLLLLLLATGCIPWMDRTELRLNEIARETRTLNTQQEQLATEIARIRSLLETEGLSTDEDRAELLTRLRTLERSVEQLSARAQEQESLLRRMSAALDQLTRQGPRVDPGIAAATPPAGAAALADTAAILAADAADPDTLVEAPVEEGPPEILLYDAAMRDFRRGSFILARAGFEELVYRYPNSQLADNAAYWLGETLYAEADFAAALARFQEVLELYPAGDTLPAAMLKSAYCQLELEDRDEAVATFLQVIQNFPDTEEALNATHRLAALGVAR